MPTSADLASREYVLLVPLGAHEQHGPHLPLDTDTRIAVEVCRRAASRLAWTVIGPTIAVSASDEHSGFAGTLSLGTETTAGVLGAVARSAVANGTGCLGTVFVNSHGGNVDAIRLAAAGWSNDAVPAAAWSFPAPAGADLHAGRLETSLMLAIEPAAVRPELARAGNLQSLDEILPAMRAGGVAAVSPGGVLGDPAGADAAEGHVLLDAAADDLVVFAGNRLREWRRS